MKIYRGLIVVFICTVLFNMGVVSCLKQAEKDGYYPCKPIAEGVRVGEVAYKTDYSQQSFYSLKDNKIVSTNSFADWDLAFDSSDKGMNIYLNSAKFMHAANTQKTKLDEVCSPKGWKFAFDASSGNLDSLAMAKWGVNNNGTYVSKKEVYVLDLGADASGKALGYKKLIVEDLQNGAFHLRYADMDGSNETSFRVQKQDNKRRVYFSFDEGGKQVDVEPDKNQWDLLFTQYTTYLYDGKQYIEYLVRGVLSNKGVEVGRISTIPFANLCSKDISGVEFSKNADGIGHTWKKFDMTSFTYVVLDKRIYIVRTNDQQQYKLHFTSYFNDQGQKGYPEFAYEVLY
ncbi:MAG: HmuY family protein [Bacteroidales bacterium]